MATATVIPNKIWEYHGIPIPTREYRFYPHRKWRADFCWINKKLAIEIEGGVYLGNKGGHTSPEGFKKDIEKYNKYAEEGWLLLRYLPKEIDFQQIKKVLSAREDLHNY